jgi:hypothetical protein
MLNNVASAIATPPASTKAGQIELKYSRAPLWILAAASTSAPRPQREITTSSLAEPLGEIIFTRKNEAAK